jgi:prepilin-type N-terminal cleavage/methylation domain-containing protein
MNATFPRRLRNSDGFTLIEVLTALAILGVALFALLEAHYAALSLHALTDEEVVYREFVEMTAGRAETSVLQGTLSDSGDFGLRYPDYTWSFEAEEQEPASSEGTGASFDTSIVPEGLIPLYRVTVTVTGPSQEQRSFEFYVFNTGLPQDENGGGMLNSGGQMFNRGSTPR